MPKEKLDVAFEQVLQNGDKAFVPYIMAGDGGLDQLNEQISFLEVCGATAVEVGIPFSDPVADGPTIQKAGIRALQQGVTLKKVLETLKLVKEERTIPIVVMTYFNPIYAIGIEVFAALCNHAGVDGLIIPDVPLEEEGIITEYLTKNDIAFVRLATLTSTADRVEEIINRTEGFLYAVTVTGTTGQRATFKDNLAEHLQLLQKKSTVPVLAGFGVSTPEQVKELSAHCDGVVVGSRIVDLLHEKNHDEIRKLIHAAKK
ncbi:tryptophan synthase subunit alpha [Paraliobacillus salinarum]|uniref:tryptophan synthase subunit alpha n=1 Tax=Paraliobacillus salinarum TaxID=1158996 RepID=UPI0015F61BCC|nr:tryptophan synthase subunit alpha [Paraliobacillus salinarum]